MYAAALILLAACAHKAHQVGLVEVDDNKARLLNGEGEHWKLVLDESSEPLRYVDGCGVEVYGRTLGRRFAVRRWRVLDAGDGSEPFVGRLERYGSHWVVKDRASGNEVALDPDSLAGLDAHEGQMVMVVGFVVGTLQVRVVSWRLLEEPSP